MRAIALRALWLSTLGLAVACGGAGPGSHDPSDLVDPAGRSLPGAGFDALRSDAILKVAMSYPAAAASAPEAPVSLTASDGTGLRLVRYEARAVLDGPLAFTELHLAFENPEDRVLEGRFAITLPGSASISRLAMKNDAGWQEAEVVERQLARRAYEDFLHRKQDPALLEKEAGNEFRARIFPIAPRATKEIVVAYSEELAGAEAVYRLALAGLPEVRDGRISVRGGRGGPVSRQWSGPRPEGDVRVLVDPARVALAADGMAVVRVAPKPSVGTEPIDRLTLLFDTSASRAPGFKGEVDRLGQIVAGVRRAHGDRVHLRLAVFDQRVTPIFEGPIAQLGARDLERILAHRPLGGSDLGAALAWLGSGHVTSRALLVTDGIPTVGAVDAAALRPALAALRGRVRRLDAVAVGGIRDTALLGAMVRGQVERDGVVIDGALDAEAIVGKVSRATASGVKVSVPGATWSWPTVLDGVQPGDEALVYAVFPPGRADTAPIDVRLSAPAAAELRVTPARAERALLERAAVRAEIERLTEERSRLPDGDAKGKERLARTIVARSTKYRVLSDLTALLVLEGDSDYARYGIDRNALASILAIDPSGRLVTADRTGPVLAVAQEPERRKEQNARPTAPPRPQPTPTAAPPGGPPSKGRAARPIDRAEAFDGEGAAPEKAEAKKEDAGASPATAAASAPDAPAEAKPSRGVAGGEREEPAAEAPRPMAAPPPAPPAPMMDPGVRVRPGPVATRPAAAPRPDREQEPSVQEMVARLRAEELDVPKGPPPYSGRLATIMDQLAAKQLETATVEALRWQTESPGDVMALVGLGEALEASGHRELAARAYGSIIDLFPARADLRRFAGMRLERLGSAGSAIAVDTYAKAVEQRPDHLTAYRSYAYALVRVGRFGEAVAQLRAGIHREVPGGRFASVPRILKEDLGIVAAAWLRAEPAKRDAIQRMLDQESVALATRPSLRFILQWETDANDVDFHIHDAKKGHAFYSQKQLPSGGELYDDVTTGYGPECFAIEGEPQAYPYRARIHYYSRGPMGFGMGRLEILRHDGQGGLGFEERPFVVMNDGAYVDLGSVTRETAPVVTR